MKFIGLNFGEYNSSAAACQDGEVLAGCLEERYTRQKKTQLFPKNSLKFVLKEMGVSLAEVDAIGQAWNPGARWVTYNPLISTNRIKREDYFYSLPDNLYNFVQRNPSDYIRQDINGDIPPIYYIKHHLCHAANAFFLSNFEKAAFLTADWQGELESLTKGIGDQNHLRTLDTQWVPNSIGMFYATFTQLLGYRPDNDEWKVMAMSAEQVETSLFEERILQTVKLLPDGHFELDQSVYTGALLDQPLLYSHKLLSLLDHSNEQKNQKFDYEWQCKVARAMQNVAERIIWHVLDDLYEKTKCENLVLSGGFFMNSVLNGKVLSNTKFKRVYISHSPDDSGNSIGAALYLSHCVNNLQRMIPTKNLSNIGPSFTDQEIKSCLNRRNISFKKIDNAERTVAQILAEGNVVAIHQGNMEFGDRALGFRSILGDPRYSEMKNIINKMIKYRESYRPFAPATLSEFASTIFDVCENYQCNYMEKVVKIRKEWQKKIPAVTHFDGSGRLQTVRKSENPYFYKVIKEFNLITNVPVLLNTSFNINGEPIVLSPDDALNTFYNSGLKHLMIGNYLVQK